MERNIEGQKQINTAASQRSGVSVIIKIQAVSITVLSATLRNRNNLGQGHILILFQYEERNFHFSLFYNANILK